jgi:hypothetical protein
MRSSHTQPHTLMNILQFPRRPTSSKRARSKASHLCKGSVRPPKPAPATHILLEEREGGRERERERERERKRAEEGESILGPHENISRYVFVTTAIQQRPPWVRSNMTEQYGRACSGHIVIRILSYLPIRLNTCIHDCYLCISSMCVRVCV